MGDVMVYILNISLEILEVSVNSQNYMQKITFEFKHYQILCIFQFCNLYCFCNNYYNR